MTDNKPADDPAAGTSRAILHVDMNAFFAEVEILDNPSLRGRPVVVGGDGPRGVVAAASYEARVFGIRSAMASSEARRRCPHAVFVSGRHDRYREVSEAVMERFAQLTPLVEPLSLDEAFLDVSGALVRGGSAVELATELRADIHRQQRLWCSVGVASSKLVAKLASEEAKPTITGRKIERGTGVFVVEPGDELPFLRPMGVRALWGVGPATYEKLSRRGIETVGELADLPLDAVVAAVGRANGTHLWSIANGIDNRKVEPERPTKSISAEVTFPSDVFDLDRLTAELIRMADSVTSRLRGANVWAKTVTVKARYPTFRTVTRSRTLARPTNSATDVVAASRELLDDVDTANGLRLLGVGVSGLSDHVADQLTLDDLLAGDSGVDRRSTDDVVDEIRDRFGVDSIGSARLLDRGDRELDSSPWGPSSSTEQAGDRRE